MQLSSDTRMNDLDFDPDAEPLPPRRPAPRRHVLATPAGAGGLAAVLVVLVAAIVLVPGLLPGGATGPTPTPGGPGPTPSPEGSPTAVPSPTFTRPTPTPLPTFTSYVVRAGDSLNSIADQFDTTPRSIAWWNRGTYPSLDPESAAYEPDHIELGWILVILPGATVDDANPPTPSPGAPTPPPTVPPTAGPTGTPTPTAQPGAAATVISSGPRGTTKIALTFDMGGRLDPAVEMVQWLIDHEVHATLFPTGKSASETTEGRAAMELAATRPDLFDFANHSWDHPDFTTLTAAQMADQLTRTEDAIQDVIGQSTKPWFRPPYGAWTYEVRAGVGAAGWEYVVMWDIDTIDWRNTADGGPTAADIVTKVVSRAQGGSIVLMHLGGWHTLEALPGILDGLQDRGLTPVTLSEMLGV